MSDKTKSALTELVAKIRDDYDNCRLAGDPMAERIADTLLARIDELELELREAAAHPEYWRWSVRRAPVKELVQNACPICQAVTERKI